MTDLRKIFVVINPTTDNQHALIRGAAIARNAGARIHAYAAVYSDHDTDDIEALRRVEIARHEMWLESVVAPLRAEGLEIETQVDW
jgi:universal stress protein E